MSRITSILIAACALLYVSSTVIGQSDHALANAKWKDLLSQIGTPAPPWWERSPRSERSKAVIEIKRRILADELSDAQWDDLLTPERLFKWRETWLNGVPLQVQLLVPDWLGSPFEIRATPRLVDGKTLRAGRTWAGPCGLTNAHLAGREPAFNGVERCGAVGMLDDTDSSVVFDVEIRTGADEGEHPLVAYSSRMWDDSRVVRNAVLSLDVRQVDDASEVCQPVASSEAHCKVGSVIRPSVYHHNWADGSMHAYLIIDLDRRSGQCSDLGLGLVVELLKDGHVVESIDIPGWTFWECSTGCYSAGGERMFEALLNQEDDLMDPDHMKRWSLRIKGTKQMAWSAWSYSAHWSGEFTIPLADVYKDLQARQLGCTTVRIGGQTKDE